MLSTVASPLTGAPGAVALYGLVALIAWPNGRRGGLLGRRATLVTWTALWSVMAWLWLTTANSGAVSRHDQRRAFGDELDHTSAGLGRAGRRAATACGSRSCWQHCRWRSGSAC